MESNTALRVALILVALAVLMQAAAMVGIWLALRKIPPQVEGIRTDLKQRLDPLTQAVTEVVTNSREPLERITANLADISHMLRERTANVDALVAELVDKTRVQIIRVDQMVSGLVERVENTADAVERQVLGPVQEVSAVLKGLRSGLEFLFSRRRVSNVSEATQDEQLFI